MNKIRLLALLILVGVCLCACDREDPIIASDFSGVLQDPIDPSLTEGSFSDALLRATAADGNRTVSPFSAKLCLALLANGASGETRAQILDAIGVTDLDAYNRSVAEILKRYATYGDVMSLSVADSLWLNQSRFGGKGEFLKSYEEAMRTYYAAEAREVTDKNSIEEVNKWVKEKTNGKIDSILTEDLRKFSAALVNAVYFKAQWENTFDEQATAKGEFTNADGTKSTVEFMHQTDRFGYYEADGVKALKMDYSSYDKKTYKYVSDADFSMYVFLADTLPDVEKLLAEASFFYEEVRVTIPKFEFSYSIGLDPILQALGVTDAYDAALADFSQMIDPALCPNGLCLSTVLQKTYVKVDESGTEAAAVTAAAMTETAMVPSERIYDFTADRPFCFAVRDNTSGEILFLGSYEYGE